MMEQNNRKAACLRLLSGGLLLAAGIAASLLTRTAALAENAADSQKFPFALGLIAILLGATLLIAGLVNLTGSVQKKKLDSHQMVLAAMFAALCYIGFSFFKIDIPVGTEKTAFHLGNVFCVLAALLIGGLWGGMAGAVGMTVADLTTGYVTSAPKTFLLKLCIGLIVGLVAHKGFHVSREKPASKIALEAGISAAAGMAFNVVADPVVGYFYKTYVLGIPQKAAGLLAKMSAVTTLVNAIIAVLVATVFYLALRPALKGAKLYKPL